MFFDFNLGFRAFIVLLLVVPLVTRRFSKGSPAAAFAIAVLVPWIFGPRIAAFDLPILPPLRRTHLGTIGALFGTLLYARHRWRAAMPLRVADYFVGLIMIASFGGYLTNRDAIYFEESSLAALTFRDVPFYVIGTTITTLLPLILGRALVRSRADAIAFLHVFAIAGLSYLPLILWELRMSPQLHTHLYGYSPGGSFAQHMRGGGYRPIVFLGHGLKVGMFMMSSALCAFTLWRINKARIWRVPTGIAASAIIVATLLLKAKAAMVYLLVSLVVIRLVRPGKIAIFATCLCVLPFIYAELHLTEQFPQEEILAYLAPFGEERLQSMEFRFDNETALSARAGERLWFGWGGYGRERIYDKAGTDLSVQDGAWIIKLGQRGLVGFIGFFGAVLWTLLNSIRVIRRVHSRTDQQLIATFALLCALHTFNAVPNGSGPLIFIFTGATLGLLDGIPAEQRRSARKRRASQRVSAEPPSTPTAVS